MLVASVAGVACQTGRRSVPAPLPGSATAAGPSALGRFRDSADVERQIAAAVTDGPVAVLVSEAVSSSLPSPGSDAAGSGEAPGGQSLSQAASDPTASLLALQFQNQYLSAYHGLDDATGDTLLFRAAVPFKTGCLSHIGRLTAPIVFDTPADASGLGDVVLFDLIVFEKSWGRWGVGPVAQFPTASEESLGSGKWAAGPAVGFTARSGKLLWGAFNQNLFSYAGDAHRADVNVSSLQPIVNYSLPCQWSVGTSEMNLLYDWDDGRWAALPLGFRVSKLVKLGTIPVQVSAGYEHNFVDDSVGPKDTFTFTLKFLLPVGN